MIGFTERLLAEARPLSDYCSEDRVPQLYSLLLSHSREALARRMRHDPLGDSNTSGWEAVDSARESKGSGNSGSEINVCFGQTNSTTSVEETDTASMELIDLTGIDDEDEKPTGSGSSSAHHQQTGAAPSLPSMKEGKKEGNAAGWLEKALTSSAPAWKGVETGRGYAG